MPALLNHAVLLDRLHIFAHQEVHFQRGRDKSAKIADYLITDDGMVLHQQTLFEVGTDGCTGRNTTNGLVYAVKRDKTSERADFELWGFDGAQWVLKRTICYQKEGNCTNELNKVGVSGIFWDISPDGERIAALEIVGKSALIMILGEKETKRIQYPLGKDIVSPMMSFDWESEESLCSVLSLTLLVSTYPYGWATHISLQVDPFRSKKGERKSL
jgi:hypothetical protein